MAQHKCDNEETRQILYEATYDFAVSIMELIDGYSNYSADKHDIINIVTGERLKENPFIELHDILDGTLKSWYRSWKQQKIWISRDGKSELLCENENENKYSSTWKNTNRR